MTSTCLHGLRPSQQLPASLTRGFLGARAGRLQLHPNTRGLRAPAFPDLQSSPPGHPRVAQQPAWPSPRAHGRRFSTGRLRDPAPALQRGVDGWRKREIERAGALPAEWVRRASAAEPGRSPLLGQAPLPNAAGELAGNARGRSRGARPGGICWHRCLGPLPPNAR